MFFVNLRFYRKLGNRNEFVLDVLVYSVILCGVCYLSLLLCSFTFALFQPLKTEIMTLNTGGGTLIYYVALTY